MSPLPSALKVREELPITDARAFVHGLNVLLKYARLYGLEHSRAAAQFESTWDELQHGVQAGGEAGLLLGASGSQLLLDGVPLESTHAERSFAELLNTSGVASICFSPGVTRNEFENLVRAFMEAGPKAGPLTERLVRLFASKSPSGIRVNEIRFVAEDAAFADARMAAQLTARTLGTDASLIQDWFSSPQKMIQLIAAAEGAHSSACSAEMSGKSADGSKRAGPGEGSGDPVATFGTPEQIGGSLRLGSDISSLDEAALQGLLRLLGQFGEATHARNTAQFDAAAWQQKLGSLPQTAQINLRQALATVVAQTPSAKVDEAMLLRLAENLAIRFALDRFESGEVRVNAVRQLLDRMNDELGTLRKLLNAREDKMAGAGLSVESHADVLDRQFWAAVPESGKRAVLTSAEAWCIPPRNVQQYVEELLGRGESEVAGDVLLQYASCVRNQDTEARKKAAIGLGQLAELFSKAANQRLQGALLQIGEQMEAEQDAELQTLLSAAFVRLSHEASSRRYYSAMQQSLDSLAQLERSRPSWVRSLRPRIGIENRAAEFIEEAVSCERMPDGLSGVLVRIPLAAAEHLSVRLARSWKQSEREKIVQIAQSVGPACAKALEEILRTEQPAKAAAAVG
jgi:hypothetical protein